MNEAIERTLLGREEFDLRICDFDITLPPQMPPTVTMFKRDVERQSKVLDYLLNYFAELCEKPKESITLGDVENMRLGIGAARGLETLRKLRGRKMDGVEAMLYAIATDRRVRSTGKPDAFGRNGELNGVWNHKIEANATSSVFTLRDFINPDGSVVEWKEELKRA